MKSIYGYSVVKEFNLTFINLKGSTNVEVPEEIKSRAVDVGGGMWDLEGED